MKPEEKAKLLADVKAELNSLVSRDDFIKAIAGTLTKGSLRNLDCTSNGPAGKIRLNRKVVYTRDSVLAWIEERI